jgi:hypothetical protein
LSYDAVRLAQGIGHERVKRYAGRNGALPARKWDDVLSVLRFIWAVSGQGIDTLFANRLIGLAEDVVLAGIKFALNALDDPIARLDDQVLTVKCLVSGDHNPLHDALGIDNYGLLTKGSRHYESPKNPAGARRSGESGREQMAAGPGEI